METRPNQRLYQKHFFQNWVLFNAVRFYKSPGGNELAEPFLTLPSKRELPDYYLTIPEPISLNMVIIFVENYFE
jgi:Bromodomain